MTPRIRPGSKSIMPPAPSLSRLSKSSGSHKAQQSKKKRAVTILKDEFIPSVNLDLTEALSAYVEGDIIYFLFPGVILKYNITYNIFEEEVKIAESKS